MTIELLSFFVFSLFVTNLVTLYQYIKSLEDFRKEYAELQKDIERVKKNLFL